MLERVLAISGKPGLYLLISRGSRSLIVETLDAQKKRMPASAAAKVISLADIAMYTDAEEVELFLEGDGVIEGVGSADPQTVSHYQDLRWNSYDGRLLCILRGNGKPGEMTLRITADGIKTEELVICTK